MSYRDAMLAREARRALLRERLAELAAEEARIHELRSELGMLDRIDQRDRRMRWLIWTVIIAGALATLSQGAVWEWRAHRHSQRPSARHHAMMLRQVATLYLLLHGHAACPTVAELVAARELGEPVTDPWGHEYLIACYRDDEGDTGVVVVAAGPDGQLGSDDDVVNR